MYTCRTNDAGLRAKLAEWKRNTLPATIQHVRGIVADVVSHADEIAPADTNKYRRAWVQAGIECGANVRRMPALQESAYNKRLRKALIAQAARIDDRIRELRNEYAYRSNRGRDRKGFNRKILAHIALLERRKAKAQEHIAALARNPSATVIRRKVAYVLAGNDRRDKRKTHLDGYAVEIEVRKKIYGGSGTLYAIPGRVTAKLHIMEPHAATIENKHMVKRRAIAYARTRATFGTSRRAFVVMVKHGIRQATYF